MSGPRLTRAFARNAAESAYPNLWRGLVAAWAPPGAPRHATRLWDYSGTGNHGTLQNGTSWTAGKNGHALKFDGIDDDVIGDTPGKNFPTGNQSRTVCCWIKSSGWTGDRGLLHWGQDGGTPAGSNYQIVAGADGTIHWGNGYGHGILKGTTVVSDGKWHHIVGIYSDGDAFIYIDGRLDKFGNHTPSTILTTEWRWGRFQNSFGAWNGEMENCLVFRRALVPTEISYLASNINIFPKLKNIQHCCFSKIGMNFISITC